ncbi:hypothetical protein MNV_60022 [Candidatus Methanoperedens nitroreducens]|uniref:Uncharacterized protein n=1 Tax=Candidatus Methanoperedens nitratireducens TaxID=1392998 RepID=A0A284VS76_9EURY|nr:hypothetical protein MNV_60022 [Candidatus Methanoperedens nitroreducens]
MDVEIYSKKESQREIYICRQFMYKPTGIWKIIGARYECCP